MLPPPRDVAVDCGRHHKLCSARLDLVVCVRLIDLGHGCFGGAVVGVVGVAGTRQTANRRLALLILCGANLALVVAIAGNITVLSDVLAPLTGHFMGVGLAASLGLLTRRLAALGVVLLLTLRA